MAPHHIFSTGGASVRKLAHILTYVGTPFTALPHISCTGGALHHVVSPVAEPHTALHPILSTVKGWAPSGAVSCRGGTEAPHKVTHVPWQGEFSSCALRRLTGEDAQDSSGEGDLGLGLVGGGADLDALDSEQGDDHAAEAQQQRDDHQGATRLHVSCRAGDTST